MKRITCVSVLLICISASPKAQQRYDVVISELMADPNPPAGLPAVEWVELHNRSAQPVNLQAWRLADAASQSGAFPSFILHPGRQVIICANSAVPLLSPYGACIGVSSFPSLDNDGDLLSIRTAAGQIMHAVPYSIHWYQDDVKKNGGWSLEMIDINQPCFWEGNWRASIRAEGGTPGQPNSLARLLHPAPPPVARHCFMKDSMTVIIEFSAAVDSAMATGINHFSIADAPPIIRSGITEPLARQVWLQLADTLAPRRIYQLQVNGLAGCNGTIAGTVQALPLGRSSKALHAGIVINEILFHPRTGGHDYVELFHAGELVIDLAELMLGRRVSSGQIQQVYRLTADPRLFFPGDYLVITTDSNSLHRQYTVYFPERVWQIPTLPTYPNDNGIVVLLNNQGQVLDEVPYSSGMHFPLIRNAAGVALERIDPRAISSDAGNWHSAAASAGYGTPGYANSQLHINPLHHTGLQLSGRSFTPDNDGWNDLLFIHYQMAAAGAVINVRVFDVQGRLVRILVSNGLMGTRGSWHWNGLDDKGQPAIAGVYIIHAEIFELNGKKKLFKHPVVLARRF